MRTVITLSDAEQIEVDTLAANCKRSRAQTLRTLLIVGLKAVNKSPDLFDQCVPQRIKAAPKCTIVTQPDPNSIPTNTYGFRGITMLPTDTSEVSLSNDDITDLLKV